MLALSLPAIGEIPDPNPVPRPDGTFIWYTGVDTQYPVIQDVLNACSDGDEIVVAAGLYVESLEVVRNDITLRPYCLPANVAPNPTQPHWASVTFWNPTEGFNNANGYAIRMTGARNTYVGAPRQLTELDNNFMQPTTVVPDEYLGIAAGTASVMAENVTRYTFGPSTPWNPAAVPPNSPQRPALQFWSRSIDNVAVYSTDGEGTFHYCGFTSEDGYGGGAIITGESNSTQFVQCNFISTFADGDPLRLADGTFGPPVNVITIEGGAPQFIRVWMNGCFAGANAEGAILDQGSRSLWNRCAFTENMAPTCRGTYCCWQGTPNFERCLFRNLISWKGTFYWDSTGIESPDGMDFHRCNFVRCRTSDLQYGAVAYVECDGCEGDSPRILLDECGFLDNQNANIVFPFPPVSPPPPVPPPTITVPGLAPPGTIVSFWTPYDVWTPYYPKFRIGGWLNYPATVGITDAGQPVAGDVNGDGVVDTDDLEDMQTALGTCAIDTNYDGTVGIEDLLGVIGEFGSTCP